ncbi:MAG: threonine ammonia-lyase IlvA, partial [Candidatus Dormibacteraeota bacterium]|nr:threonine ammonia-lyase IlvA [Candidatus Dormibacteraeota bacterium]
MAAVDAAASRLAGVVTRTPLQWSRRLSRQYGAEVLLKREDLQDVRSFKIRGAYNRISALTPEERRRGVVCASAGNHAQGVAFACSDLRIHGTVFMPAVTPTQKVERVKHFGGDQVDVVLTGDTYDAASEAAERHHDQVGAVFVHPFDDLHTIAGQGTVGCEIVQDLARAPDVLVAAVGGGGLISGLAVQLKHISPGVRVIGAEPAGAASMSAALAAGRPVTLDRIDTFIDGAAVKTVGSLTFEICARHLERMVAVAEGKVCTTMVDLYQNDGIIAEPAGALAVAALDDVADLLVGRTVVCLLSGGNNDILRYPEIMERSLVHQGRKHYFIVEFAQRPGQLRRFVDLALGPTDDIV